MLRVFLRRLPIAVLTLFAITTATFLLFFAVPGDPAAAQCGRLCTAAQVRQVSVTLELNRPIMDQYLTYLGGLVIGRTIGSGTSAIHCPAPCLGYSFQSAQPVGSMIGHALPVTVSIILGATVMWVTSGIVLGLLAASFAGRWVDRVVGTLSMAAASVQLFFVALLLEIVFVYGLHWLPPPTFVSPLASPGRWLVGMLLPWIALSFTHLALFSRLTRVQILEVLSSDFIRTAAAKGLTRFRVNLRHALRASASPLLTVTGLQLATAVSGAAITEVVFGLPGVGELSVTAAQNFDLPVVMGGMQAAGAFVVFVNIATDLLYPLLDPRIRDTARKHGDLRAS